MIVVLDTNVIVSALLSPGGPPAEIISRWEAERFEVVTCPPLLSELERALQYPRVKTYLRCSPTDVDAFIERFARVATLVQPRLTVDVIEDDRADSRVLECAVAGGAAYIISGDDHLLRIKEYQEIVILSLAGFLTLLDLR